MNEDLFYLLLFEIKITYKAELKIHEKVSEGENTHSSFDLCRLPGRQKLWNTDTDTEIFRT